jgi:hypothetical protein
LGKHNQENKNKIVGGNNEEKIDLSKKKGGNN